MTPREESRLQIVLLPEEYILEIMRGETVVGEWAAPPDAELVSIHSDYQRRAVAVVLASAEFPILPKGSQIPVIDDPWEIVART